ncbi:MAG TPA: hypothetical protein VJ916_00040 [Anaerovoracaceae bacterium]|nr:hypothetical protein [Anaerovoracaceae bacterium]
MKRINVALIATVIVSLLILSACSVSVTTANYNNINMASEVDEATYEPITITDEFTKDTPIIFLTAVLENAPEETMAGAEWYYMDAGDEVFIDSAEVEAMDSTTPLLFSLSSPTEGWPIGEYMVKLFIDREYDQAVSFFVE